jgi:hypothetical protein
LLLIRGIFTAVRQKNHLSACPNFPSHLSCRRRLFFARNLRSFNPTCRRIGRAPAVGQPGDMGAIDLPAEGAFKAPPNLPTIIGRADNPAKI